MKLQISIIITLLLQTIIFGQLQLKDKIYSTIKIQTESEIKSSQINTSLDTLRPFWHSIGPENSTVNDFIVDENDENIIIAATNNNGVMKTTVSGNTWSLFNEGLPTLNIRKISQIPNESKDLYAIAKNYGLYHYSIDSLKWEKVLSLNDSTVSNLSFDPDHPDNVFLASSINKVIYKSEDGLISWDTVYVPKDGDDENTNTYFYFSYKGNHKIYVQHYSTNKFYVYSDDGISWEAFLTNRVDPNELINDFIIHPENPDILYYLNSVGDIYKSTDSGINWNKFDSPGLTEIQNAARMSDLSMYLVEVLILQNDPQNLYLVLWSFNNYNNWDTYLLKTSLNGEGITYLDRNLESAGRPLYKSYEEDKYLIASWNGIQKLDPDYLPPNDMECFSFFPMHVGDECEYKKIKYGPINISTTYYKMRISKKEIMPNGKTYYMVSPFVNKARWVGVDSTYLYLVEYNPNDSTETIWLDLSATNKSISIYPYGSGLHSFIFIRTKTELIDTLFGIEKPTTTYIKDHIISEEYRLTKNFGMSYWKAFEITGSESFLIGAVIDGIEYGSLITKVDNECELPEEFVLQQNYPNPFNPNTTIKYSIPSVETTRRVVCTIKVYDVLGREVATLVNREQAPGNYSVRFDAGHLSSGLYFYRLTAGGFKSTKKMLLIR